MKGVRPLAALCAALSILSMAVLTGCRPEGNASTATAQTTGTVTGTVVTAEGSGVTDLQSLEVRDAGGKVWSFAASGFVGETPSHLKQHMITRVPIVVTYERQQDGTLLATRVEDTVMN